MDRLLFVFQVMIYVGIGLPLLNILLGAVTSAFSGGSGVDAAGEGADFGGDLDLDLDIDLDGALDAGLDLDLGDVDIGDLELEPDVLSAMGDVGDLDISGSTPTQARAPFVQFNLYCLCLALVILGAMGIFSLSRAAALLPVMLGLSLLLAVAAYILLYRFVILPLRKNYAKALNLHDLTYKHAVVSFRILPDSPGQIQTRDAVGAWISYRAEMDKDICKAGRINERDEVIITEVNRETNVCYVAPAQNKQLT